MRSSSLLRTVEHLFLVAIPKKKAFYKEQKKSKKTMYSLNIGIIAIKDKGPKSNEI